MAFKLMDHQWLSMRASYMDFNVSIPYSQFVEIGEDITAQPNLTKGM
jgi:hypothetical protein